MPVHRSVKSAIPFLAVFLVLLAQPYHAQAELSDRWDQQYRGIYHLHRYGIDASGVRQNYHIAIIDLEETSLTIKTLLNQDTWKGAKETVRGMALRNNAALAVNGNYWNWGKYDPSQGTTAVDGVCYRAHPERSAIAFNQDRSRVEIGRFGTWPIAENPPDDCPDWFNQAIGAGPQFLFQGEGRWESSPNPVDNTHVDINGDTFFGPEARDWGNGRDPNTAAAITPDGRTLILMTCDGRGAGGAGGCRVAIDMAEILLEFGASDALKLDSGGSTTFFYAGDVVNQVSEGSERAVVDALGVFSPRLDPSACDAVLTNNATIISHTTQCFTRSGNAWWLHSASQNTRSWYTWTISGAAAESVGRWQVNTGPGGWYNIEAFVPDLSQLSKNARYSFQLASQQHDSTSLNLDEHKGRWFRIGTVDLPPNETLRIQLGDNTGEEFFGKDDPRNRRLAFDRIQLIPTTAPADSGTEQGFDGGPFDDSAAPNDSNSAVDAEDKDADVPSNSSSNGFGKAEGGCGCKSALPEQAIASIGLLACLWFFVRRRR